MVFDQPRIGRHRSTGRHRADGRRRTSAPPATYAMIRPRRRALPAGLATLLSVLAGASAVSGWFAAHGASAVVSMIAH
jgi:hypothetical protein